MKLHCGISFAPWHRVRRWALWFGLLTLAVAASAANSFVEGLQNFVVVDSAVDADGVTYLLGKSGANNGVIRKYDTSGGVLLWKTNSTDTTNVIIDRLISGIVPAALHVAPGTANLYVVGGSNLFRLSKDTGALLAKTNGPASLGLRDVAYRDNYLYLCGTLAGATTTVFGGTANSRGSQAAIAIKFKANFSASATVVTFGFTGYDTADSLVVDDSGNVYVGGHLSSGGTFGSDFGLSGQWNVRQVKSSQPITSLATALGVLDGANVQSTWSGLYSTINFGGGGAGHFNGDASFPGGEQEEFALEAFGMIQIPQPGGTYTFYNNTDDGGYLKVDGTTVIYDSTLHGAIDKSGTMALAPGIAPGRVCHV